MNKYTYKGFNSSQLCYGTEPDNSKWNHDSIIVKTSLSRVIYLCNKSTIHRIGEEVYKYFRVYE